MIRFHLRYRVLAGALLLLAAPALAHAQAASDRQAENLRVFLDCDRCDFDYFRREVPFVNYVRDRADAQLHVLVTQQATGAGGLAYTFHFIGLGPMAAVQDTLFYTSLPDETDDVTRAGLVRTFKLGLVPFASPTPLGRYLDVTYSGPTGTPTQEEARDPWNLWVFEARVSSEVSGEERTSERSFDGSFGANRTTAAVKVDLSLRGAYSERTFELSEGKELSTSKNHELAGSVVWSLGPHWSWGLSGSATISTRLNQDLATRFGPAIEYDIFPYVESNRRQFTFFYTVELATFDYEEVTLFGKTAETRIEQTLEASAAFEQPWGAIDASVEWANYMDDFAMHRLEFSSRLEIRLFRGLSLELDGNVARVKNQIYLPREDIPDEDILLERRQLGTDFEYNFDVGFSYTFGSVFNNVVNPRMNRGNHWY